MRRSLVTALTAAFVLVMAVPALAQSDDAAVTVVHGVPGLPVDVYVNGEETLSDFQPGTVTEPLSLPPGDYEVEVYPAGADPSAEDPAISATASVPAGANVSLVAHLDADGNPTLTPFANDTSSVPAGEARLTVRHTAAAPAVDVRANGEVAFSSLENPNEATTTLPAGTISADVVLAGESEPVLGPTDLTLSEGTSTIVYAIGSAEEGTLDLLVQSISDLGSAPSGVPSGDGGMADDGLPLWAVGLMGIAAIGVLGATVQLARTRA